MTSARANFGFLSFRGFFYVIGGRIVSSSFTRRTSTVDVVEKYDISNGKWKNLPHHPYTLSADSPVSVAAYKNCLIVCGYCEAEEGGCNPLMLFNTKTYQWHTLSKRYLGVSLVYVFVPDTSESVYLITFQSVKLKFSKSRQWKQCPAVYKYTCDIESNPTAPTISYKKEVDQKHVPETDMQIFRIGSFVYIIVAGFVYKASVRISDDQMEDVDLSLYSCLASIDSNEYAVTYCGLNGKYVK